MDNKQGKECIQHMKDLFIEGCANGFYKGAEEMKDQAKQLLAIDRLVKEFTDYMNTEDKENYDFEGLMSRLKVTGEDDE